MTTNNLEPSSRQENQEERNLEKEHIRGTPGMLGMQKKQTYSIMVA